MLNILLVKNIRINRIISWKIVWLSMFLIMVWEISGFVRLYGLRCNKFFVGGFVVNVNDVNEFMIRFIYSSWVLVNGFIYNNYI